MPTVEKNSNVHWLGNCISFDSTSSNKQHSAKKIPDYNIANFDVLKLPVFRGMFLHPPQWWRGFCTRCNHSHELPQLVTPPMNLSKLRSLSEMFNMSVLADHPPITALGCCHVSSSGSKRINAAELNTKVQSKIRLHIECLRNSCSAIRLPFAFAFVSLSSLLSLMKVPSNAIGLLGHFPGKITSKVKL